MIEAYQIPYSTNVENSLQSNALYKALDLQKNDPLGKFMADLFIDISSNNWFKLKNIAMGQTVLSKLQGLEQPNEVEITLTYGKIEDGDIFRFLHVNRAIDQRGKYHSDLIIEAVGKQPVTIQNDTVQTIDYFSDQYISFLNNIISQINLQDSTISLNTEVIFHKSLTKREVEIIKLVAHGLSNQEIGNSLMIETNTVKVHVRHIFEKLRAGSRAEAAALWSTYR